MAIFIETIILNMKVINGYKNKTLSIEEYLNKIIPYLKNINNLKNSDTWEIQLTIPVNFMSSKNTDEERLIYSKSDNIETMINDKADEVIEELFQSLLSRYQIDVETTMKGSSFIFDHVHLLYSKCNKIYPNRGGSYIGSPKWIINNKATNPIDDNNCFQYAICHLH